MQLRERLRRSHLIALIALSPSILQALTDDFSVDPTTNGDWELYEPGGPGLYSVVDGHWRVMIPAGVNFDTWVGADRGIQLRRADFPADDFVVETRVKIVGSGDPLSPISPPVDESYLANLMVLFSPNDLFHWGPQRGYRLVNQRVGQADTVCRLEPGLDEVSLQIKKAGTHYTFSWRAADTEPWVLACEQEVDVPPIQVGLIFKTWDPPTTLDETFDFDYFTLDVVPPEKPAISPPCPIADPDTAWYGMPYLRELSVAGFPAPTVTLRSGPDGLVYDPALKTLGGWTPAAYGAVAVSLEAANDNGTASLAFNVSVEGASSRHDDEFDLDPALNTPFFELYESQPGLITYSIQDLQDGNWWRLEVPGGVSFDTWVNTDRAPQLRHPVDPDADFLIETRVRIAPEAPPSATDNFLAGLLVTFANSWDIIHWAVGQERLVGGQKQNVFIERSGINGIAYGNVDGLLQGRPVDLRLERRCSSYRFFYRAMNDPTWTLAGVYQTADPPQYVGLVMKTWGNGVAFTCDFDSFDLVDPGPRPDFSLSSAEGPAPLMVSLDASASSSPHGAITAYDWDFGDGHIGAGPALSHTFLQRGDYVITLKITDASGDTGSAARQVRALFPSGDVKPWTSLDIGDPLPVVAGGARFEGAPSCLDCFGSGKDIAATADSFNFTWRPFKGDASIIARLDHADWQLNGRVGLMIREDLSPGSRHASILYQNTAAGLKAQFLRRETAGGSAKPAKAANDAATLPNAWLKIERLGGDVIGSWSADGAAWTEVSRVTLNLGEKIYGGLAVTGRDTNGAGLTAEAFFCEVQATGANDPPTGTPFRRGDVDGDGKLTVTDAIGSLSHQFLGDNSAWLCAEAADFDNDGVENVTDPVNSLTFQFLGGNPPAAPGPYNCGSDTGPVFLGCNTSCQ